MAKLQRDDAKMLWEEMGEDKNWGSLTNVLQQHVEKSKGIEDCTVRALLGEAKQFQKSKEDFPGSRTAMLQMLNKNIEDYRGECDEKGKHTEKRQQRETHPEEKKSSQEHTSSSRRQHGEQHHQPAKSQHQQDQHRQESRGQSTGGSSSRSTGAMNAQQQARRSQSAMQGMEQQSTQRANKAPEQKMTAPQKSDQEMATAYQPMHIEMLYTRGNWKNWDEMIRWLEGNGQADSAFNEMEIQHLIRDLQILRDSGAPFTPNHAQVFELIHGRRG